MTEQYRSDSELAALSGTTPTCGAKNPTLNADPWYVDYYKQLSRLTDSMVILTGCEVYKDGALTYGVRAGRFIHAGQVVAYAGSTGNALTDDQTNYIFLTAAGVLTVNTTGFTDPAAIRLAEIVAASGAYSIADGDITDRRSDALLRTMGQDQLRSHVVSIMQCRNIDGSAMDATGGAGKFAVTTGGFGGGEMAIDGEAASGNTKTDQMCFQFQLPPNYVASGDVKIAINAKETIGAATVSTTISAEVYEDDGQTGMSADLAASWDDDDITTSWATHTLTLTDAGLVAGDVINVLIQIVTDDTGGAVGTVAEIGRIDVQCDVYQEF